MSHPADAGSQLPAELQRRCLEVDGAGNERYGKELWTASMDAYRRAMNGGFTPDQLTKIVNNPNAVELLAAGAGEIFLKEIQASQEPFAGKDEKDRGASSERHYQLWREAQRKNRSR